jgi:hypothetical protein
MYYFSLFYYVGSTRWINHYYETIQSQYEATFEEISLSDEDDGIVTPIPFHVASTSSLNRPNNVKLVPDFSPENTAVDLEPTYTLPIHSIENVVPPSAEADILLSTNLREMLTLMLLKLLRKRFADYVKQLEDLPSQSKNIKYVDSGNNCNCNLQSKSETHLKQMRLGFQTSKTQGSFDQVRMQCLFEEQSLIIHVHYKIRDIVRFLLKLCYKNDTRRICNCLETHMTLQNSLKCSKKR